MPETQIPVEYLFTLTIRNIASTEFDFDGPFGPRMFAKAHGGTASGPGLNGKVVEHLATDYGRASPDRTIRAPEGDVVIQADDGTIILAQYRGRMSPAYGEGRSRLQFLFKTSEGPHYWLHNVQAIGFGEEKDGDLIVEIHALAGADPFEGPASTGTGADRTSVTADFIMRRRSVYTGAAEERHVISSPLGSRFLTVAEGGGAFTGPRVSGEFLSGYSWSPHYIHVKDKDFLLHYDVKTLLREQDGTPILMSYTGVTSSYYPDASWRTATLFETPDGPHGWLNEVLAVGVGTYMGDGALYMVYALR